MIKHIVIECDDEDIIANHQCDRNCEEMAKDGYCNSGYTKISPKCVFLRPVKAFCPKSCNMCGKYQFSFTYGI